MSSSTGADLALPPGADLTSSLVQLSFIVQAVLGRAAQGEGLSVTQMRMLAVLEDREIGMRELAAILELEKHSVTGLVDRAVRRDLVRRVAVPGDRRSVHVRVTPTGLSLMKAVREVVRSEVDELSLALSSSQQARLSRAISSLIDQYTARRWWQ